MQAEPSPSVEAIFSQALEQPNPEARRAFLENACGSDTRLLEELTSLVTAHEHAVGFLPEAANTPPPPDEPSPPVIPGFRINRLLGKGGMGAVYHAFDEKLQREVALKVLARGANAEFRRRILIEARKAASLRDPAIVTIFSVFDEGSAPAISMELVEGFPVDRATSALSFEQKARILLRIAQAIAAAHRSGVIHRDLKPENVLLTPDLQPKILDFGLAISLDEAGANRAFFEGTPRYASPEQVGGRPLTPATDIFSFGSLMFKILTGRPAFDGETALEILEAICNSNPPFLKDVAVGVPEGLQAICLACLAWKPEDRPTASDIAVDLKRFLTGEPVRLRPALYGDILRKKISEYSNELVHWERQGMISTDEKDRLEAVHRRILADEDHWIIDARKISGAQTILYTGAWLVVVSAILTVWLARDQLPAPWPWLAPACGTLWLLAVGIVSWRRREAMASASFLAAAALSLAPTVLAVLSQMRVLEGQSESVKQLLDDFSNRQILAASLVSLCVSSIAWRRLKMSGFAWTSAILGAASFWSILLQFNWLEKEPEIQALWLLPLCFFQLAGFLCERHGHVRWALPFNLIALATLVAALDVIAFHGPTLAMLGFNETAFPFLNADRQRHFSVALNGYLFLALTLLTERAKSLDLRRASRVLEPLSLLHILGFLFANALAQRDSPGIRIDVSLYLVSTAVLLILGPWRSSWRMLVGALGGLAFGSYLLIDLGLVGKTSFSLGLGIVGIIASAAIYSRLVQAASKGDAHPSKTPLHETFRDGEPRN